jgi:hypothetical protein
MVGGIKLGDGIGLTGAYRFKDKLTAEVLLKPEIFSDYSLVSVMVKRHYSILGSRRLNLFAGGGLFTLSESNLIDSRTNAFGIGFALGCEMTVGRVNVSYDYLPLFTVNQNDYNKNFHMNNGFSIRYVFDKRESKVKGSFNKLKDKFKKKK